MSEKSQNYLENRKEIIGLSHQSYRKSLDVGSKKNLSQCVTSMILQIAPPEMKYGMDRQLRLRTGQIMIWVAENIDPTRITRIDLVLIMF